MISDENQIKVVEKLDEFCKRIETPKENSSNQSTLAKLFKFLKLGDKKSNAPLKGVYLYGDIGCGVRYYYF